MSTYSAFKEKEVSNKETLAILNASKRLVSWVVHSGSVYKKTNFTDSVINSIEEDGSALVDAGSLGAISAGEYFHDRANQILYLQTTGSVDPSTVFIGLEFKLFFSESGLNAPHDLSTGFDVHWDALIDSTSSFNSEIDSEQIGIAVEGNGSIKFHNDQTYWSPKFDKLYFENKKILIYSWSLSLPITEAKIIYKGKIINKSWSSKSIGFRLKDLVNELRKPIPLSRLSAISGANNIETGLENAYQREIYGYVFGHRPVNLDSVKDGYDLTGTIAITTNTDTVTGTSTQFLTDFFPGDKISTTDTDSDLIVGSITSDTSLTLTEIYTDASISGSSYKVIPERSKRYMNRIWLVAGHALKEPATTVTKAYSTLLFDVASTTDFLQGDEIVVNSENKIIQRISGSTIRLTTSLIDTPSGSVTRQSITDVRLNDQLLQKDRDYSIDATNAELTLTNTAEFNIANTKELNGTSVAFSTGSRTVTGVTTFFTSELRPGDWLRVKGNSAFFEISEVLSDTSLKLTQNPSYTDTDTGQYKFVDAFNNSSDVITCSCLGKTDDGNKTGVFLKKPAQVVEQILKDIGLTADIESTSFSTANDIAEARIGLVIPKNFNSTTTMKAKDIIDEINQSIFGALVQNEDFQLEYKILKPSRITTDDKYDEGDILNFKVNTKSEKVVKQANIQYKRNEYDYTIQGESYSLASSQNKNGRLLGKTTNEADRTTVLVDSNDADIYASRLAFILDAATNIIQIETKMRPMRSQVTDSIIIDHPKLFERVGTNIKRRVGQVQSIQKGTTGVMLELEDLGAAFSRCAAITENTANSYSSSSIAEKIINGYITDAGGMIDNDETTYGVNLIW